MGGGGGGGFRGNRYLRKQVGDKPISNKVQNKQFEEVCRRLKLTLYIECSSRFRCRGKIILAKSDLYCPTHEQQEREDFDWLKFDWATQGNNIYDGLLLKHFSTGTSKFVVEKVTVGKFADLKINFTNGLILEVFVETSGHDECWRFFEADRIDQEHLVITGQDIEEVLPE